jgi:D-threo-aldose 1-dehydrogenase
MTARDKLQAGRLAISPLGFGGGSAFGGLAEGGAIDLLGYAYRRGIRYFDTAPFYSLGQSERRFGALLRDRPRGDYILSTKVGRLVRPSTDPAAADAKAMQVVYDYTYEGTLRSLDESLERLGLDRIDIAYIHDVSPKWQGADYDRRFGEAMEGAYRALDRLRQEGTLGAIGVGVKDWEVCLRFARAGNFDCFMLAGGYTLLEHAALDEFLPYCVDNRIGVIVASPFNSGILATGATADASFFYNVAPPQILERTRRIEQICARYSVPLGAAALQFPLLHPAVVSVVAGYGAASEVDASLDWGSYPIPAALWADLKSEKLLPDAAPVSREAA